VADTRREVVVTGLGVVSPLGSDVEAFWRNLCAGRPAAMPITRFDTTGYRTDSAQTIARDSCPGDPAIAFGLDAAAQAITQAGLDAPLLRDCGLAVATTAAGWTRGQRLFTAHLNADGAGFEALQVQPQYLLKEGLLRALAGQFGIEGPCALLSPACAAASSAIAWAAQRIRDGGANLMLACASDALTEVVFAGFHAMRLLAPTPAARSAPDAAAWCSAKALHSSSSKRRRTPVREASSRWPG
jgi:3-oxoacyl-[acyl-carrier-protein] synthase II